MEMKVRPGGDEWVWLHRNSSMGRMEVGEEDSDYNLVTLVISRVQIEKFKALFVRGELATFTWQQEGLVEITEEDSNNRMEIVEDLIRKESSDEEITVSYF